MTAPVSVTESSLAQQVVAFDEATHPMRMTLADNLWTGWLRAKPRGGSQHEYLQGVIREVRRLRPDSRRSVTDLYRYLYTGCARAAAFTPADLTAGELIGKALDRLGLTPDVVRGHLDAGNLADVLEGARASTISARVTREAHKALNEQAAETRTLTRADGLSESEIRSAPVVGLARVPRQIRDYVIRAGLGESLPQAFLFEPDAQNPDEPGAITELPKDYLHFLAHHMPCWVTGVTPTPYRLNHLHHVRVGEVEARPGDDTPAVLVPVQPLAHIPLPSLPGSGAAHSRAFVIGLDAYRLAALNRWQACAARAYSAWQRREDWQAWADRANGERLTVSVTETPAPLTMPASGSDAGGPQ